MTRYFMLFYSTSHLFKSFITKSRINIFKLNFYWWIIWIKCRPNVFHFEREQLYSHLYSNLHICMHGTLSSFWNLLSYVNLLLHLDFRSITHHVNHTEKSFEHFTDVSFKSHSKQSSQDCQYIFQIVYIQIYFYALSFISIKKWKGNNCDVWILHNGNSTLGSLYIS